MDDFFYDNIETFFKVIAIAIVALIIIIPLSCMNTNKWNDGVHQGCGGHWQFEQAVGHMFTTDYLYICDKCATKQFFMDMR